MTSFTHCVNVACLAEWSSFVSVNGSALIKVGMTTIAVKMFRMPRLVQGTNAILKTNMSVKMMRLMLNKLTLRMNPLQDAHRGTNLFL